MKLLQFVELVRAMRSAQRVYFDTRTRSALTQAKALERRVDQAVATMLPADATARQAQLFEQR